MTENTSRSVTDRLTVLEAGMDHMRQTLAYRESMLQERIDRLDAQNRAQDQAAERFTARLEAQVAKIDATLWRGMGWLVTATASLLLAAALKVLGVV